MEMQKGKLIGFLILACALLIESSFLYSQHVQLRETNAASYLNLIGYIDDSLSDLNEYRETGNTENLAKLSARLRVLGMEAQRLDRLQNETPELQFPEGVIPLDAKLESLRTNGSQSELSQYLSKIQDHFETYKEEQAVNVSIEDRNQAFVRLWKKLMD